MLHCELHQLVVYKHWRLIWTTGVLSSCMSEPTRFSSAALLCAETGAHINQSHVYVCVCFSSSEQPALRHHGRTASSGVSKCGAALLPPNQVRVSLQPQPRSPVEQQWLDWCFWGTHARSGFSGNLRKNFQFRFDWTVGSNLYTLYFVFLTA